MPILGDGVSGFLLHTCPLWLFGGLLVAACMAARELGALLYRYRARKGWSPPEGKSEADNHINGAVFSLLAFVLGLTFSIALDRYDARRALVAEEANAIAATYLRAELFDEPARTRLQTTLRDYAHTRIAPNSLWDERMEAQLQRSLTLRARLREEARAAVLPVRETDQASYFLEAVSDVLSAGVRRQLAGKSHIPARIMDVLLLYMLIASAALGYLAKGDNSRRPAAAILMLLFSIIIVLILDLDRPRTGAIAVPQQALEQLVKQLDADAAR